MSNVKSFLETNEAKRKATSKKSKEEQDALMESKEKYEKFRRLCDTQDWKDCRDFIKDEIYQGLSLAPGDVGTGDWWLKYCWGLKACIERIESHAKKYDEAIKELSK